MRSTFRNPTLVCCFFLLVATVATRTYSKSIIRDILERRQPFAPEGSSPNIKNGAGQMEIGQCRISLNKELTAKLNRLCDDCFQTYRVANFYTQCRSDCFDNNISKGCALALYRQDLTNELNKFLESPEVKIFGVTLPPTSTSTTMTPADKKELAIEALLQNLERTAAAAAVA